jgi:hypothetical protein
MARWSWRRKEMNPDDSPEYRQFVKLLADIMQSAEEQPADESHTDEAQPLGHALSSARPAEMQPSPAARDTHDADLWEVRTLPDGMTLELWGGANPALVLVQGERRVRVNLADVRAVVAGLVDAGGGPGGAAGRGREASCLRR